MPTTTTTDELKRSCTNVRDLAAGLERATAERNQLMRRRREEGASLAEIAREAGLTKPAIAKVLGKTPS